MTTPLALRPGFAVIGSVMAFALLIERVGLVPAVLATVLVASLGSSRARLGHALLLAAALAFALSLLFVGLLGQPFALVTGP